MNLLGNAIKFTSEGNVVLKVELESVHDGVAEVHFIVHDSGIGIAAEKRRLIFEAFSQADGSTTRKFGGTGLGLAISARLVEMMGGRIWVESELGQGSRFHFTGLFGLVTQKQRDPDRDLDLAGTPVLVVDANTTTRNILAGLLNSWKMQPYLADDPEIALSVLRERRIPLALVAKSRAVDGFRFVHEIEESGHAGRTSVVMLLSPRDLTSGALRCRELGISHLPRPVLPVELRQIIQVALASPARSPERFTVISSL